MAVTSHINILSISNNGNFKILLLITSKTTLKILVMVLKTTQNYLYFQKDLVIKLLKAENA